MDGEESFDTLQHLKRALRAQGPDSSPDVSIAIGLDANILLNIGKGRTSADLIDYLGQRHVGPLILPAQAMIEFWNNQAGGIHALADNVKQKFDELSSVIEHLDPSYKDFRDKSRDLLVEFTDRYGHVMEERIAGQLTTLLDVLEATALVPSVPRAPLDSVARRRQAAKIPPGFKDGGHGDFYVWCEFLLGLLAARDSGATFRRVVLVTDDKKPDWSTKGTTHPSLCAEVEYLVQAHFETWSLQTLARFVEASLADDGQGAEVEVLAGGAAGEDETPPVEDR